MSEQFSLCDGCREKNKIFLGRQVYIPKGARHVSPEVVFSLWDRGLKVPKIAEKTGVTPRRIFQILQKLRSRHTD